jgi:Ni/Fe-hydrogenase 1 B-type cytochrome subunit
MEDKLRKEVYIWELPVRLSHWINFLCMLILGFTGYYIYDPFLSTNGLLPDSFTMGIMRFIHLITAFVFSISVVYRIIWGFMGNKYVKWWKALPVNRYKVKELMETFRFYFWLKKYPPAEEGHSSLAMSSYTVIYILFLVQILTGLSLFAEVFPHGSLWKILFSWIINHYGAMYVRLTHNLIMYLLFAFFMHHIYSAILFEIIEKNGIISSMVNGYKFIPTKSSQLSESS